MNCNLKALSIVGFTFFKTKYEAGYNDYVRRDSDALSWAKESKLHDPLLEAIVFRENVSQYQASGRQIVLGHYVAKSIS